MMRVVIISLLLLAANTASWADEQCPPLLDYRFRTLAADDKVRLCETYRDKVILVVNTASKCGYTYQYEGLENLYRRYRDRGLVVIGFPSNDFAGQEPGKEGEIAKFCRLTYGVEFPMMEKSHVAAGRANDFFNHLAQVSGNYPRWNFHKYLVGRDGQYIDNWRSNTEPESKDVIDAIERALGRE